MLEYEIVDRMSLQRGSAPLELIVLAGNGHGNGI